MLILNLGVIEYPPRISSEQISKLIEERKRCFIYVKELMEKNNIMRQQVKLNAGSPYNFGRMRAIFSNKASIRKRVPKVPFFYLYASLLIIER